MDFSLSVGTSDFEAMRNAGSYYVDKTGILYDIVENTKDAISLFTRPRRFGKTLMMSMIANFFDIRKDSRDLFKGLAVMEHKGFCEKWMNRRPVIFISCKDVEGLDFDGAYKMLENLISVLCLKIPDLADIADAAPEEKALYARLKAKTADVSEIKGSLKTVMSLLYSAYGQKVILLIDEYDVPLAHASERDDTYQNVSGAGQTGLPGSGEYSRPGGRSGYYDSMLDVLRGIMSTSLKDNEYLEFAVITGCLRIAKESIFTGANNFTSYSVLDDRFSDCFGFTEAEVGRMLEAAGVSEAAGTVKEWYDGYIFGNSRMYCPWDVVNYVRELRDNINARPKNYWKNTSHNGILKTFVERTDFDVSEKFETLMNGGMIEQNISDGLTYNMIHSSEDNLWSVLLMTGYVTRNDTSETGEIVHLRIPNKEIASIFEDTVLIYFRETVDVSEVRSLMDAFWDGDEDEAGSRLSDLLWDTISYNDYHEDYYHAFLAGVFVGRGYNVQSNKEKGLGRPDILLRDRKNRRALIIEAKISSKESDMDRDCSRALSQIMEKKYASDDSLYGYRQIMCYGVAFYKKEAKVKKMQTGDSLRSK